MNIRDFINYIITFDNIDDILEKYKTQSEKGIIFERLFDVVIKFGFCDVFKNTEYIHLIGNSNNGKPKILKNLNKFLNKNIISGNSNGCSDITLQNKTNDTYIFISSKYPKSNESVDYYDVQNIVAMASKNKHIYKNYKIYLVVPNKRKVLDKVKNANKSSEYITEHMIKKHILDKDDLNKYFLLFKQDIIKNKNGNWQSIYLNNKKKLNLRFHQELITQKTCDLIEQGNKSFLWGCKCRSGKTFMIGGIIAKQLNIKKKLNVLIITPAPTETIPQFTDDLFNKFTDFDKFNIYHIENLKIINNIKTAENNIFVISKQFLQKYINDETIIKIKNLKLDIIGFDENHFSGTTDLSKDILTSYSSKNTVKIYLTATYNKPLKEWNILPECQMYWDMEDEQICKSILNDENNINNINKLKEKHGDEYINKTIEYYTDLGMSIEDTFKCYEKMPDLHLITNMFDQQRYETIKQNIMGSHYGFSFDVLFSLNEKKKFNYNNEIKTVLRYISGSEKEQDYKTGDKSIFTRINNICSRTPFTQIWFLPSNNINYISQNLKILMSEDKIFKKYNIMCINRQNNDLAKNIKDEILKQETITKSENKQGLILLAGNMLSLGITINKCDIVMLMNNTLSSDKVMQQMYRCMTEEKNKKMGFVVDLNISRVLNTCVNYTVYKNNKSIEDKIKYLIENHLINIDVDMMNTKNLNSNNIIKKLMDIWKTDPLNNFKTLLKNLDDDYIIFDNPTQKLLNASFTNSLKDDKIDLTIKMNDNETQELPDGKEKIKNNDTCNKNNENNENKIKEEIKISFTKDVLPYVIPLTCILTIKNKNKDFMHMLNNIKENKELLEIFDDQCLIWWNKKGLINIIHDIINKYFEKSSNTYNISIQFKLSIQSLLDRPKELLELISDCLKPKTIEKKTFGEVFTPMDFINDKMLKDIEDYWLKNKNENIWENKKLTWYDPATGMGNYPVAIYYRLMEGLKNKIPNENKRKKHIIEKQLHMGELNKKNCFVVKQIFNINNKYNLNLYEGNTLEINLNDVFKKTNFDIIIGNPPYNEELKTKQGSAPALYNKFIEYYMNKCNLLSFIVPSRWFASGKGLDKFREMMLNKTDIVYIKHYDDACKIFGNTVDIKGGVNYFLIDKNYNGLCDYNGSELKLSNYDIFVDSKYYNIINKIMIHKSLSNIFIGQSYSGINSNDERLIDKNTNTTLLCYVSQQKGFIKYIEKNKITKNRNFNKWKIITTRSAFGAYSGFGNMFIGKPNEICNQSYVIFEVNSENEAKSLLSYMKCKLPNLLLSIRKSSQDISESTCKWIPLPPLNKEWNDNEVYEYFKLSKDEIKLIKETKINGFKD